MAELLANHVRNTYRRTKIISVIKKYSYINLNENEITTARKKSEIKSCHNTTWTDDYSWIHQSNILEVLKDSSKLLPEVRKYLEDENDYFSNQMKDTENLQKNFLMR